MSEDVSVEAAPEVAPEVVENPESSDVVESAPEVAEAISADPEAAAEIAEAVESGEMSTEEAVAAIRKLTLKVDGQEIEEELPFDATPEMVEYLQKKLQLAAVSNKRMQEAAELKKNGAQRESELEAFLGRLGDEGELDAILKHFGHDPANYAEKVLSRELEKMEMDPKDLELQELKEAMQKIEDEKVKAEEVQKQMEFKALQDKFAAEFEHDLISAMDAGELPNNPYNIRKAANYMSQAVDRGLDVSFKEIVDIVKTEHNDHVRQTLSGLSADQILEIIGDKKANDIVLKRAPKAKKEAPPTAKSIPESGSAKKGIQPAKRRNGNSDDFFNKLIRGQ